MELKLHLPKVGKVVAQIGQLGIWANCVELESTQFTNFLLPKWIVSAHVHIATDWNRRTRLHFLRSRSICHIANQSIDDYPD